MPIPIVLPLLLLSIPDAPLASAPDEVDLLAPYFGVTPLDAEDLVRDAVDDAPDNQESAELDDLSDQLDGHASPAPFWAALLPDLTVSVEHDELYATGSTLKSESGTTFMLSAAFGSARSPRKLAAVSTTFPDALPDGPADPGVPTIAEVVEAAERAALVHLSDAENWKGRARAAAWLPDLSVDYRRNVGEIDTLGVQSNLGIDSHNLEDVSRYGVSAHWRLGEIVFSRQELSAAKAALGVQRERQELLTHVTEIYFARLRAAARLRQAAAPETPELSITCAELTAKLDALTAGFFSKRVNELRAEVAK